MTAQDMLTQARQGNPQAIAVILNHFTRPKEITTDVTAYEDTLRVVFSAHRLPNQSVMTAFVRRSIEQLDIEAVRFVQVVGQRVGNNPAMWVSELDLDSDPGSLAASPANDDHTLEQSGNGHGMGAIAPVASPDVKSETSPHDENTSEPPPSEPSTVATVSRSLQDLAESPIMRRPEAVVLILFVLVLILWQTYLAIIEGAAPEGSLNGRELARRLAVSYSTISRRKHREDFSQWSQALDPDGITWVYTDGVFVPQL